MAMSMSCWPTDFYPRPPRGGRLVSAAALSKFCKFLSTPSARRATLIGQAKLTPQILFLSTPSARRATRSVWATLKHQIIFLSTPSARRATSTAAGAATIYTVFLSTPSARRATRGLYADLHGHAISIHALREEGDSRWPCRPYRQGNFYPRPPRGGRPVPHSSNLAAILFLSTPSARRATAVEGAESVILEISIHALREEGDLRPGRKSEPQRDFYPRPPRGGRHWRDWAMP